MVQVSGTMFARCLFLTEFRWNERDSLRSFAHLLLVGILVVNVHASSFIGIRCVICVEWRAHSDVMQSIEIDMIHELHDKVATWAPQERDATFAVVHLLSCKVWIVVDCIIFNVELRIEICRLCFLLALAVLMCQFTCEMTPDAKHAGTYPSPLKSATAME